MNLLPATVVGDDAVYRSLRVPLTPEQRAALTSSEVTVGVRPEAWAPAGEGSGGLDVTVVVVEELGSEAFLYCTVDIDDPTARQVVARAEGLGDTTKGDRLTLVPRLDRIHVFDTHTGARLT